MVDLLSLARFAVDGGADAAVNILKFRVSFSLESASLVRWMHFASMCLASISEWMVKGVLPSWRRRSSAPKTGHIWTSCSDPTLRQCHETSRIFTGTKQISASAERGDIISYRFVFEGKRDFWLVGCPEPLKSPKSQKVPFFEKTNI